MDPSVFETKDYKKYLNQLARERPRGFRKALAEATHCQSAYVSHVLNGAMHFNLEQAEAVARFLGFTQAETRFWLLLLEHDRAGTPQLKRVLSDQLDEIRAQHRQELVEKRIGIRETLSQDNQAIYYSSWQYAAVHMTATVPSLQTREALARSLRIGSRKLGQVLEFLLSVGLLSRQGSRFIPGSTQLHLDRNSPLVDQHHANWRAQALDSLHDNSAESDVHYSSVLTLSAADAQKLRALIANQLGEWIGIVKESKEEQVHGLTLDFFRVDQP